MEKKIPQQVFEIKNKLKNLPSNLLEKYNKQLDSICEWKDSCKLYGAKNLITLPKLDYRFIQYNLYQEMFENRKPKDFLYLEDFL